MHTPTHLAISWICGHRMEHVQDRRLIAISGVIPDLDGLSILFGIEAYAKWHHTLTHGIVGAFLVSVIVVWLSQRRWWTLLLSLLTFHLHLFCDLIGTRWGGMQYFWPFSSHKYYLSYGWLLDSWQNYFIAAMALLIIVVISLFRGYSFLETFLPQKTDANIVTAVRKIFS